MCIDIITLKRHSKNSIHKLKIIIHCELLFSVYNTKNEWTGRFISVASNIFINLFVYQTPILNNSHWKLIEVELRRNAGYQTESPITEYKLKSIKISVHVGRKRLLRRYFDRLSGRNRWNARFYPSANGPEFIKRSL